MSDDLQMSIQLMRDRHAPAAERLALLGALRPGDLVVVREALLQIAKDPDESPEIACIAGGRLARLHGSGAVISDLVLADFTEPAYLGFDEQMAEILTAPPSR